MKDSITLLIIYDGQCPLCAFYMRTLRLKKVFSHVEFLDARLQDARVIDYTRQGYDINKGLLVILGSSVYSGSEAMRVLVGCSTRMGFFNECNARIFSSPFLSKVLYPVLTGGRRILLFLLRRKLIDIRHSNYN